MTIQPDRVRALRALYATGKVSYREAAERIGISPRAAAMILAGHGRHAQAEAVAADPDPEYEGKPVRCSECGSLCPDPCAVCAARAAVRPEADEADAGLAGDLVIELKGAAWRRYEALRALKAAAADAALEELAGERLDPAAADEYFTALGQEAMHRETT